MISSKLYKRILEKKKIVGSFRPFDKMQLKKLKEDFIVEYVYDSTSIEGNTLTLNETRLVLQEGITIGGKSLREHLDVTNQKEAMGWIEDLTKKKRKINEADILTLHKLTLKGISDYWAGKYKTSQNRIVGSKLKTTPPYKVTGEMRSLLTSINRNSKKYNPIELAAYAHHELVRIHPFVDGNGRVARLLCNLILMSKGYVPMIIRNRDRKKYFDVLEKAHFGDLEKFVNFIGLMEEEALMRYINALQKTTKKNELLPLSEISKGSKYSQEYLSLLARRGLLPATKINGVWHSSKEELEKYMRSIGIGQN